jgi:hypothetical protein
VVREPLAGQPKLPPAAKGLVERGLMRLDESSPRMPRLFFTEPGLGELRAMIADRRFANPAKFAHVSQALGRTAERAGSVIRAQCMGWREAMLTSVMIPTVCQPRGQLTVTAARAR